jgi:hypothetical protein
MKANVLERRRKNAVVAHLNSATIAGAEKNHETLQLGERELILGPLEYKAKCLPLHRIVRFYALHRHHKETVELLAE